MRYILTLTLHDNDTKKATLSEGDRARVDEQLRRWHPQLAGRQFLELPTEHADERDAVYIMAILSYTIERDVTEIEGWSGSRSS